MLSMEEFYSRTGYGELFFYAVAVASSLFLVVAGLLRLLPYANISAVWIAIAGLGCIAITVITAIRNRGAGFLVPNRLKLTISATIVSSVLVLVLVL